MEDSGLPYGIGLSEDELGFVGVGDEDVRLGEYDLEPVEILAGPGRRDVEQGQGPRGAGPAEPIGQLVGVEVGEDQEIPDVQDTRRALQHRVQIGGHEPVLAPTVWMKRRSSPRTLMIRVWLVGSDGSTFSAAQSIPRLCRVSVANRPKLSVPTRAQIAVRTPSRARSTAVLAAPPPMFKTRLSTAINSPGRGK